MFEICPLHSEQPDTIDFAIRQFVWKYLAWLAPVYMPLKTVDILRPALSPRLARLIFRRHESKSSGVPRDASHCRRTGHGRAISARPTARPQYAAAAPASPEPERTARVEGSGA